MTRAPATTTTTTTTTATSAVTAASALALPDRNRMPVARINHHADQHGIALARLDAAGDGAAVVDHSRLFTCPSLTPLSHASIYATLTEPQQRRYNQLVGLMQNELICFFEQEFAARVLPAVLDRSRGLPAELAASLRQFVEDERQHTRMFRRLNRLAEPAWYADGDYHVLQLRPAMLRSLRVLTGHPQWFPMVFWVMLLMEERSLMISHRYAAMPAERLDPQFAATYRAHAEDEVRHVQLDWHLLERFYESRPRWLRRANARLLEWFVVGLFLKPRRANVRLVDLLIAEFPELAPRRPALVRAVYELADNPGYRRLMYSGESTPIGRALLARLPEFGRLRRFLYAEDR